MADIVILTHAHDVFLRRTYLLESLFSYWRQAGHEVGIVRGIKDVEGDLAIQHVDCSVIPADYRRLAARFTRVINGAPNVREATRTSVLKVIDHLGYRPSHLAASLSRGTARTMAIVVPHLTRPSVVRNKFSGLMSR